VDDHQLIDHILRGDAAAERALYDAHVDRVYRLAYRMTGDEAMAQEYTQDTFIRAFDRLPSFRRESALSTWLHSITMSVVLNGLRKVRRLRARETDLDAAHEVSHRHASGDLMLRRRLHAAIDALGDEHRAVVVLHDVEGLKHQEIAALLGIQVGTSKARLSRARAALRERLDTLVSESS
jgi:RNA polymerase sigma-70 factor (ECF subfamily)